MIQSRSLFISFVQMFFLPSSQDIELIFLIAAVFFPLQYESEYFYAV